MTEPLATLITRTVTVNEVMDQCGKKRLTYDTDDDDLTLWDVKAMLDSVLIDVDAGIARMWANPDDD